MIEATFHLNTIKCIYPFVSASNDMYILFNTMFHYFASHSCAFVLMKCTDRYSDI